MKEVARLRTSLEPGELLRVEHPPYDICVANVDGELLAIEDACPHSSQSLSCGRIVDCAVVCPSHDWLIDLRTGRVLEPSWTDASNPTYLVRMEGSELVVYDVNDA